MNKYSSLRIPDLKSSPKAAMALTMALALFLGLAVVPTIVRAQGQKPAVIQITSLLARVPIPESCKACYSPCAKTIDASGITTLVDNGPVFNQLNKELTNLMNVDMNAMSSGPPAMQAQASANRKPPAMNPLVMKELGQASQANMQIQLLTQELSKKLGSLTVGSTTPEPNCPDVMQGGYAGPTCACALARAKAGQSKQVAARDRVIQGQATFFREYLPKLADQVAIIDKLESDAKYGQGITDQTILSMLWSAQRQALGAYTSVLSMSSGVWSDGARQYLDLVNGTIDHCGDKK